MDIQPTFITESQQTPDTHQNTGTSEPVDFNPFNPN